MSLKTSKDGLMGWVALCVLLCGLVMGGSSSAAVEKGEPGAPEEDAVRTLKVMSYNVENFFDLKHDEAKRDWEFLPVGYPGKDEGCQTSSNPKSCRETNWTEERFQIKLESVTQAVTRENDRIPDILGLIEVENETVVSAIAQKLGFSRFVMTNSPDIRGIDVALAFRPSKDLALVEWREHVIDDPATGKATRNVLEAEFLVGGTNRLVVYMNHWPSQAAPSPARIAVAKVVRTLADARLKADPSTRILVMGDLNTIPSDFPHPIKEIFLNSSIETPFKDIGTEFRESNKIASQLKRQMPLGSYFFPQNMEWNELDRFLVSPNFMASKKNASGLSVVVESYAIRAPKFMSRPYQYKYAEDALFGSVVTGTPCKYRFDADNVETAGYSDHFPIQVLLSY